jgi:glutathione synthase/RimK-type ligase-like ATP-grasp enzyme
MAHITVLTPDPSDPSYAGQWPEVLARLDRTLANGGHRLTPTPWTDHIATADGLMAADLVLPVIAWGYHRRHADWLTATRTWAEAGVRMANPPSVLGWNSDKAYLNRLAEAGVPIPPTIWTDGVTQARVDDAFARLGTDRIVVKPKVSAGAFQTLRLSPGEALIQPPTGPAMIQPYLPTIETEGETSLLFFGGRFSHAVNKRPVPGDFRIQVQFGGKYRSVEPDSAALAVADRVLAAIKGPLLYARIDLAPDADRQWLLMEAELIEPDFYLANDPAKGAGFVKAVERLLA